MAEQHSEEQAQQAAYNPLNFLKSPFPAPPPFWKHFTTDNLARVAEHQSTEFSTATKLPFELAVLSPPPPPTTGTYDAFARPNQVAPRADPPPSEMMLFDIASPRFNPAVMLTRLTRSLLLNFLELVTVLTDNPAERGDKMEDIRKLIINVHAVINMYRPHQARESVRERLLGILEDGEREMQQADEVKARVEEFLKEVKGLQLETVGNGVNGDGEVNGTAGERSGEDERAREARRMWEMVHDIARE